MSTGTLPTTNPNADSTSVTEAITRSTWASVPEPSSSR